MARFLRWFLGVCHIWVLFWGALPWRCFWHCFFTPLVYVAVPATSAAAQHQLPLLMNYNHKLLKYLSKTCAKMMTCKTLNIKQLFVCLCESPSLSMSLLPLCVCMVCLHAYCVGVWYESEVSVWITSHKSWSWKNYTGNTTQTKSKSYDTNSGLNSTLSDTHTHTSTYILLIEIDFVRNTNKKWQGTISDTLPQTNTHTHWKTLRKCHS